MALTNLEKTQVKAIVDAAIATERLNTQSMISAALAIQKTEIINMLNSGSVSNLKVTSFAAGETVALTKTIINALP